MEGTPDSYLTVPDPPAGDVALQGRKTSFSYFVTPGVISVTESDAGMDPRTTHTTLDRLDRVVKIVTPDPVTGVTSISGEQRENGGFVTTFGYDNLGNLLAVTDALGNNTTFSYDDLNRIVKQSRPSPTGSGPSTDTTFAYQSMPEGWLVTTTDPTGSVIDVQTDSLGRTVRISGDTPTQHFLYWTDGLVRTSIDELNRRTEYNYDARGRLVSVTDPRPNSQTSHSVTTYQYTIDSLLSSVTDPLGRVTSFTHDDGGRVIRATQPDPGNGQSAFTDYVLDALGNVTSQADALGNTHRVTRDAWFRVISQIDPDDGVTSFVRDVFGNTTSVTDPLGNVTDFAFNTVNQLVSEDKNGDARTFSYDGVGNLRSAVDRNDRLTQWNYDRLYRVTSETWRANSSPSSSVLRTFNYFYDRADRLIEVADSHPLAADYAFMYDARGQLQIELQEHRLLSQYIFFDRDYDAVGNRTVLDANIGGWVIGGAVSGGHAAFRNSYTFDRMDRLTAVSQSVRTGGHATQPKAATFTYDAASQVTDLRRYASTGASNLQVHTRFTRDDAGRLTAVTHGGNQIAHGEFWDGTSTPPSSLGTSGLLAAFTLDYDQANRLTAFASWADGTETAYGYDARSQLVSAATTAIPGMTPPFGLATSEAYDFDAGGNRKSDTGGSQSAPGTHNRLQSDGTYNYFYDAEGNVIRRESISGLAATLYEWDHRNRLVAVKEAPFYQHHPSLQSVFSLHVEYIYDAFDQRIGKRVDDAPDPNAWWPQWSRYEAFVWAEGQTVLRFVDADGVGGTEPFRLASRYLWSDRVDQLLAEEQYTAGDGPSIFAGSASTTAGETFWPLTDHLGSVRGLVDNNGTVRKHITYDSFGNRIVEQHYDTAGAPVSASHAEAVDTLFGYTGRDWDADTNLQYNRARWYDPSTGRWLSQDPIGFAAGDANLYRYVGNEPTRKTDPSGLAEIVDGDPSSGGAILLVEDRLVVTGPIRRSHHGEGESTFLFHGYDAAPNPAELAYLNISRGHGRPCDWATLDKYPGWTDTIAKGANDPQAGSRAASASIFAFALAPLGSRLGQTPRPAPTRPTTASNTTPPNRPLHIDIGGEGRYPRATNVNPSATTSTTGASGRPIPNRVNARGEKLPFDAKRADGISLENAPISQRTASEIARVIKPGGSIRLVSPADYASSAHQRVIDAIPGCNVTQTTRSGITTTVITVPK